MDIVLTENMALTASLDSTVKVIDVHRGKVRTEFKGHQQGVYLLAYSWRPPVMNTTPTSGRAH
ncbi:hypothetical protein DIPPA_33794 [Diplonema papillatum]|nr:hypothetical protein DIPPA_33794 [Diplonema papillatum]